MSPSCLVIARAIKIFCLLLAAAVAPLGAAPDSLIPGSTHRLVLRDVDENDLSTSDGHVTIITVVTRQDEEKARTVADLVPDRYKGDEKYRYVTVVNFEGKLPGPLHGLTEAIIRKRLAAEARGLKPDYVAKKIQRDPRSDLHVIADFDGRVAEQLGLPAKAGGVAVFVFDGAGKLIARWSGVPPAGELPKAIAQAK